MIAINGLYDDIQEAMLAHAQEQTVSRIMEAARNGNTSVTLSSKGLTPSFMIQLQTEGIDYLVESDGRYKLFWEF